MKKTNLFSTVLVICSLRCNATITQDLIDAEFLTNGQGAVELSLPNNNSAANLNPLFAWSAKTGITTYLLEISPSASFSQIVLSRLVSGNTYNLANSDLTGLTQLDATQYYWRVSTVRFRTNLRSSTYTFHAVDSTTFYVNGSSTSPNQYGNKSAPYKLLQVAINTASALRTTNSSNIIIRVGAGTYVENIYLKPGVSIFGGYEVTGWARNVSSYTTTITASSNIAVSAGSDITSTASSSTIIDGFTIKGGTSSGASNYGFYLVNSSPTISNNTINGGACSVAGNCYGVYVTGSAPIINGNFIRGGTQTANADVYGIYADNSASPLIVNNYISAGNNSGNSFIAGIHSNQSSSSIISNNTINGGSAGALVNSVAYAIGQSFSATSIITNNILYTTGGTRRFGVYEGQSAGNLQSFQNNLLFDCSTGLYGDLVGVGGSCAGDTQRNCYNTDAQLNTAANTTNGLAASASGNLGQTSVANYAAVFFTSAADLRLTASTPLNVRCGGKDTSLNTCAAAGASSCGSVSRDFDGLLRTTGLTGNCAGASNTGAAGYSIGAYEKD